MNVIVGSRLKKGVESLWCKEKYTYHSINIIEI